jgi:hypothetical protein
MPWMTVRFGMVGTDRPGLACTRAEGFEVDRTNHFTRLPNLEEAERGHARVDSLEELALGLEQLLR